MLCRHHLKVDKCSRTAPFWDNPEGQWWRGIFPADRNLNRTPHSSLRLKEKMVRHMITYWFINCGQWLGWMVIGLGNKWQKNWGKKYAAVGRGRETFVPLVNAHQKMTSAKDEFNNQADRMALNVDISPPLFSSHPHHAVSSWAKWPCGREEGCAWTRQYGLLLNKANSYSQYQMPNLPVTQANSDSLIRHHSPGWSASYPVAYLLH